MMGSSQQFSLRWNNYVRHITGAFDSLRTDEDLVDVTLSCEGKKIRAHKMLLSACSSYFKDLFKFRQAVHKYSSLAPSTLRNLTSEQIIRCLHKMCDCRIGLSDSDKSDEDSEHNNNESNLQVKRSWKETDWRWKKVDVITTHKKCLWLKDVK